MHRVCKCFRNVKDPNLCNAWAGITRKYRVGQTLRKLCYLETAMQHSSLTET